MGIQLSIKTNQQKVSKNIKRYQSFLPRVFDKGLKQAGFHLLEIMKELTKKGIDFRRMPFAPYSEGYIRRLQKEGKQTGVDLFYSGRMLGSLTPSSSVKKTGKGKVSVAFSNSQMMKRALFNQVMSSKYKHKLNNTTRLRTAFIVSVEMEMEMAVYHCLQTNIYKSDK